MLFRKSMFAVLLLLMATVLKAEQLHKYSIGAGLSTISIMNDNPAARRIIETDTSKPVVYGGNFGAIQSGFAARLTMEFGEDGKHRVPVDVDWTIFSSGERHPISGLWTVFYWHEVHNLSLGTGYQYAFYNLDWARAKLYAGGDLRLNYIASASLKYRDQWKNSPGRDTSYIIESKDKALRLGGFLRVGLEGDLIGNWSVNASTAVGVLNLLGRDDKRGELLTPTTIFEKKEQLVPVFNFSLIIQYSF